jgi:hypothetical protein
MLLKHFHLSTDSALRDMQQLASFGEAACLCCGCKCPQRVEGWESFHGGFKMNEQN